tara:strand:- start:22 stop:192 length:171 start_codon:yes stop_codon:yes gene_type:complete
MPKVGPKAGPAAVPQGIWEYVVSIAGHSGDNPTAEDIQDYLQGLEEWYTSEKQADL